MKKKINEADESMLVTQYIRKVQEDVAKQMAAFDKASDGLMKRLFSKMNTLTGTMGGLSTQLADVQKKLESLSNDFGSKASEVLKLRDAVANLMKDGRHEDKEEILRLGKMVEELSQQLLEKKREAEDLKNSLGDTDSQVASHEEFMKQYEELANYGQEMFSKFEKLRQDYDKLKEKYSALHGKAIGHTKIDMAHTQYGKFNLKEHLERALKKQPDKNWF